VCGKPFTDSVCWLVCNLMLMPLTKMSKRLNAIGHMTIYTSFSQFFQTPASPAFGFSRHVICLLKARAKCQENLEKSRLADYTKRKVFRNEIWYLRLDRIEKKKKQNWKLETESKWDLDLDLGLVRGKWEMARHCCVCGKEENLFSWLNTWLNSKYL